MRQWLEVPVEVRGKKVKAVINPGCEEEYELDNAFWANGQELDEDELDELDADIVDAVDQVLQSAKYLCAETLLRIARLREGSYNHEKRRLAEEVERRRAEEFGEKYFSIIDYTRFYEYTLFDAAFIVCRKMEHDPDMAQFFYLALSGWWNDVLHWAKSFVEIEWK